MFSKERKFMEDCSHVETQREELLTQSDGITPFFEQSEVPVPSCIIKEVSAFCQNADVNVLRSESCDEGRAEELRTFAWLDDRSRKHLKDCECSRNRTSKNGGCIRRYKNPLSAAALYSQLKEKVWNPDIFSSSGDNSAD